MINPIDYIHKYPHRSKQILGISYKQFLQLVEQASLCQSEQRSQIEQTKIRLNAPGGGRKPILSTEGEVGLCLFYLRHLPTFEILGLQFGISKTSANDIFHYWLRILQEILPASLLEQVKNQVGDSEVVKELLTEFELLVDSTEQRRQRPNEYKEQKKFYSGKKKKHTFKNQFIILPQAQDIVDVIVAQPDPASDINLRSEFNRKNLLPSSSSKVIKLI
ncbi:transposase family protein [Chroococcidiopsis sp. SAG 2025]|uniref:transposase family protein n=1 Tax=Chroococcidiopsis sp. SAG 2025 TaxID=171389 RepID=UPI002936D55B|nr:transposase family protein [Chroococcidiopsis sp. SAG 2025]